MTVLLSSLCNDVEAEGRGELKETPTSNRDVSMFKQTTSTSTSLSASLSLFFHVPDLWRLDRRCSAIPEAIPTPRSTSLRACAQISAATPEAFVPSSLLPSRSTIVNNDIIEVKCQVSQMCPSYMQYDTAFDGSR